MRITIVGALHQKYSDEELRELVASMLHYAVEHGHVVEVESRFYAHLRQLGCPLHGVLLMPQRSQVETDLLVSMGGDGTFIRASKLIAGTEARILGINTGSLGFLANVQPDEVGEVFAELEAGIAEVEERRLLDVFVRSGDGEESHKGTVLNEAGVLRRDSASMITVNTYIDGDFVASYDSDGLLVATPTGSTAYTLSAGGPIIHPSAPTMSVVPIAPHMLNMRPLVVPDDVEIRMEPKSRSGSFLLACDGKSTTQKEGEVVIVRLSDKRLRVLHRKDHSYYKTLRDKLMWGSKVRVEHNGA